MEAYAGATSVLKRTYEALAEDFNKISDLHEPAEKKTLSCKDVFDAARNGDPIADRLRGDIIRIGDWHHQHPALF